MTDMKDWEEYKKERIKEVKRDVKFHIWEDKGRKVVNAFVDGVMVSSSELRDGKIFTDADWTGVPTPEMFMIEERIEKELL